MPFLINFSLKHLQERVDSAICIYHFLQYPITIAVFKPTYCCQTILQDAWRLWMLNTTCRRLELRRERPIDYLLMMLPTLVRVARWQQRLIFKSQHLLADFLLQLLPGLNTGWFHFFKKKLYNLIKYPSSVDSCPDTFEY